MLRLDLVQEIVARKERGESIKRIACELSVDRKTVKAQARRVATAATTAASASARPVG